MALRLEVITGSSTPIYRQVVDQIRLAAATGRVLPGDPLPSVRALAEELLVNPNTIARAYSELIRDGVAEAQQGRGVFIAVKRSVLSKAEKNRRVDAALDAFLHEAVCMDLSPDEIRELVSKRLAQMLKENKP